MGVWATQNGGDSARIAILENNVYKITYYEIISGASGTLSVPSQATINADEFGQAGNCVLSEIDGSNKPTYVTPQTAGGVNVTASLNVGTGAWVKSGVTASTNVALIYSVNIKAIYYSNLNNFYIIDTVLITDVDLSGYVPYTGATQDLNLGNYNIYANNSFLKSTTTVSAAGTTILTINSTAGQLLTGSLAQTYQLPNATTLPISAIFYFNNNSSSALTITNAVGTTIYVVPAGGAINIECTNNSTSAGSWDGHPRAPLTVTWGSGITGLVMNSVLSTTAAISAGASSSTYPVFIPQRGTPTNGYGGDSTNLYAIIGGVSKLSVSATLLSTTNSVNIGNAVTTNQRLVRIGQDTAFVDIGSLPVGTTNAAIFLNQATPALGNAALWGSASSTNLNVATSGDINIKFNNTSLVTMYGTLAGGNITNFLVTLPSMTAVTTTANSPSFKVTGSTKQWATGPLATQYFNYFSANTVAFVGVSTASEVFGAYIEAATAGTNATITNNFALGLLAGTATIKLGNLTGSTSVAAIYLNQATPSNSNYAFQSSGTTLNINGHPAVDILSDTQSMLTFNPNGGTTIPFLFKSISLNSGTFTASTEVPICKHTGATYNWGTGTLARQGFTYFASNTITFTGTSSATIVSNIIVEYVQGGTNATNVLSAAIYVPTLALTNTTTASGLVINAPTGATTNTAARFYQNNGQVDIGSITTGYSTIWMGQATPSGTNYTILMTGSSALTLQASSSVALSYAQGTQSFILGSTAVTLSDTLGIATGTTTGSKLCMTSSQKLGIWGTTPIVQPTTAVAAGTLVSNGGTTLTDTDTIDGYTLLQFVRAVRSTGLVA